MIKHTNADFPICVEQWVEYRRNEEVGEVKSSATHRRESIVIHPDKNCSQNDEHK